MSGRDDSDFISAKEAAALLGVSVTKLYVYVGRKGLRSKPVVGTRERRYWRPDVERLKRGDRIVAPAPSEIKRETSVTPIAERGPFYRGRRSTRIRCSASLTRRSRWCARRPGSSLTLRWSRCSSGGCLGCARKTRCFWSTAQSASFGGSRGCSD